MTASKLGMSIATVVLLAGAVAGHAQQAQQTQQTQQAQQAQQTQQAHSAQNAPQAANAASSATSSATTAAGNATATTSPAAKSSADTQDADPGLSSAQLKEARDDGFRPVTRGSATLYCKSEILVGSAFPIRTCYNAERLKVVMEQYQSQRMQMEQMHGSGTVTH